MKAASRESETSLATPADVDSKSHILVGDLDEAALAEEHHHHLGRVLRLRSGDCITVTDGKGSWRSAVLASGWPSRSDVEWTSDTISVPRALLPVCVGFALTKRDKPETVVQKLAELGVDEIVPFAAHFSVVRWESDKAAKNVARLQIIAQEALQQSRQAWLTKVADMTSLKELAALGAPVLRKTQQAPEVQEARGTNGAPDRQALEAIGKFGIPTRADRGGMPLMTSSARFVLIGPEGGWSEAEREILPGAVGIAPAVLRAETAAIVAGALLLARASQ